MTPDQSSTAPRSGSQTSIGQLSPLYSRLVQSGSVEAIARAIHERWRDTQLSAGNPAPTWSELDESRQHSSRDQARDITVKLDSIGCAVAPASDTGSREFAFTAQEVEALAIQEHDRWVKERLSSGWTSGTKDEQRKKTPYLVPFADLPSDIAEYDRIFVREIPTLLASAGLRAVRVKPCE
jgi:hypothetical protein